MKRIEQEELDELMVLHEKWLAGEPGGKRLDLRNMDLSELDFANKNLKFAVLRFADMQGAILTYANLENADMQGANLKGVDLRWTHLEYAKLRCANISNVYVSSYTKGYFMVCPEEGSYIAYKKCSDGKIVKLLISEDAKRSSATSRKCRASKAKVLSITSIDRKESYDDAVSNYDTSFVYKVGETVEVPDFCEERWDECAPGIHHFITREEAVLY